MFYLPKNFILFFPLFFVLLLINGCTDWRQAVGKEKYIPDEYAYYKTPKLIVPPGFNIESNTFTEEKKVDESIISFRSKTIKQ